MAKSRRPGQVLPFASADLPRLEGRFDGVQGVVLLSKRNTLGRHPDNSIRLTDREISKFHCSITREGSKLILRDESSANGTFLNGRKIRGERLCEGDELALGNTRLTVRLGELNDGADQLQLAADRALRSDHVFIYPFARLDELMAQGERKQARGKEKDKITDKVVPQERPRTPERQKSFSTELTSSVGVGELASLRAHHEKMRIASDFHQGLGLEPNADAVPTLLVRVVRQLLDADNVVLFLIDARERLVRRAASRREESQDVLPVSDAVLARVRRERATVLSGNAPGDARFAGSDSVLAFGIRSVLAVPLLVRGTLRGILHCDTRQRPDAFTDTDARILAGLVSHAALAMDDKG